MRKYPIIILEDVKDASLELLFTVMKGLIFGCSFGFGWCFSLKMISYFWK